MSVASVAAAKIYIKLADVTSVYWNTFLLTQEPYRAVVDLARNEGLHTIVDGSEDYETLVDCLEMLVCAE